jgi:hypothetical protein
MVNYLFKSLFILIIFLFSLDLSQRTIKFTPNGDGIGTYDIFQYQILNSTDTLDYLTIGEFIDSDQNHERLDNISILIEQF